MKKILNKKHNSSLNNFRFLLKCICITQIIIILFNPSLIDYLIDKCQFDFYLFYSNNLKLFLKI